MKQVSDVSLNTNLSEAGPIGQNRETKWREHTKKRVPAEAGYLAAGLILVMSHSLGAAETELGGIGQTELQQDTGDTVVNVCVGFINAGTESGGVALFDTCTAMVDNANFIINGPGGGEVPNDEGFGLTEDQLAAALQNVATEEFAVTESMTTEISTKRLGTFLTRLTEVRRGARGFSVTGFTPQSTDGLAADSDSNGQSGGARGGSAGTGDAWGEWGIFLNATYGTGDRNRTARTDAFDFDSYNIVAGADYRFTDNLVIGAALSYQDINTDFDKKATVNGGGVDADGWGGFVYGTYYADNFYIDGLAGYATSDYELSRKVFFTAAIDETAKADTDSDDFTLSAGAGYDFNQGALSYGPYARLTYLKVDVDSYDEKGADLSGLNLSVDSQDWKSLTSVLGGQLSYAISRGFGVLVPQGRLAWVHEFENDSEAFEATFIADPRQNVLRASTDDPDRDYFELGLGISAVLQGGAQLFFNYETILGFSDLTDHAFTLGGRLEF